MKNEKSNNFKLNAVIVIASMTLSGCMSTKQIGDLTMISTRNIDTKTDYVLIRNYMGGTKKELKKSRSIDLKEAINNVLKQTPGGEFIKNVKVYLVNGKYFAVEGDIWGTQENINFRGFKIADKVQYKGNLYTITELKNDKVCMIKSESDGKVKEVSYSDLKKSQ